MKPSQIVEQLCVSLLQDKERLNEVGVVALQLLIVNWLLDNNCEIKEKEES